MYVLTVFEVEAIHAERQIVRQKQFLHNGKALVLNIIPGSQLVTLLIRK